jgi:hypothetical protein
MRYLVVKGLKCFTKNKIDRSSVSGTLIQTVPVCGKKHKALNGKAKILNASLKPCQTLSQLREIHSFLLLNLNSIILTYSVMMITMKEIKLFIYNNMLSLQ